MSQPRVTVTVGQGGQRSATISSGKVHFDHNGGAITGRKLSVKDRLGGSSKSVPPNASSKRQRLERGWKQRIYTAVEDDVIMSVTVHEVQKAREDLRYKLDQKSSSRIKQLSNISADLGNDFPEILCGPLPPPEGQRVVVRRHPSLPPKATSLLGALPPPVAIASRVKAVQRVAVATHIEQPTVAGLLQSLGLGKYSITFQAEEIDMTALRNMNDDDLKELGLPMGPRKKILLALSSRR